MTRATLAVLGLALLTRPAAAQVYNSAADFNPTVTTSNPNGVWSYGSKPTSGLGGPLTLYTSLNQNIGAGIYTWNSAAPIPLVGKNTTGNLFVIGDSSVFPGQMFLHAGSATASAVRFTAPAAGVYSAAGTFSNLTANIGQNVYVYVDGVQVFSSTLASFYNASDTYSAPALTLAAGSTVDFMVGVRDDLSFTSTTVGLNATLTPMPVPEPAALLAVAAVGLAAVRRRQPIGR